MREAVSQSADVAEGATTLTFVDQLRALQLGRLGLGFAALVSLVPLSLTAERVLFGNLPLVVAPLFLFSQFASMALGIAMFPLVMAAIQAVLFLQLSPEQKHLRYRIERHAIITEDASGAAITIPRSVIRRVRETRKAFHISLRPHGARYIPKAAFAPPEIDRVRALLSEYSS